MNRQSALRFQAVHKVYAGPVPVRALGGVSLSIEEGTFTLIEGPSGSGKTTLLALAGGLDRPSAGKVYVRGLDLGIQNERSLVLFRRENVGFVFQDFRLIDVLTALENIAVALQVRGVRRAAARSRSRDMLERMGLGDRGNARPGELSGGEKQRVAIARALVSNPHLVLADEPTANLDWETGASVVEILRRAAREDLATVLVASHDVRLAGYADHRIRLLDGRIAAPRTAEVVKWR
jgi:putative ABC transport system ATP-binding protein